MDKPAGPTSHDVVHRVRRATGERAVGHTGTLDPFATGLLVVLLGRATRLARFVEGRPKTYRATVRLGERTDTDDLTGAVVEAGAPGAWPPREAVEAALAGFLGPQRQRPPAFSAKHVGGERSYRLARRGVAVELPEVEVTVDALELLGYAPPDLEFRCTVSAGTYVRALGRDLGAALGTLGHLRALRRERIGALDVADAVPLDAIGPGTAPLPALRVLEGMPRVALDGPGRVAVSHGRAVAGAPSLAGPVALVDGEVLVAVAEARAGTLQPVVVLEAA